MKWSKKYEKCIECGTTNFKHKGHGYCTYCYVRVPKIKERKTRQSRGYYKKNISKNRKRKEEHAKRIKKYYHEKIKTDPEKLKIKRERNKIYSKKNSYKIKKRLSNKRFNEKKRFRNFLNGKSIKEKNGLTIICYGCAKQCKVVSPIQDLRNEQERMKRFRYVLIKYCNKKI